MHRLYENDDITIFWDSDKCRHAKVCVHQSPTVFNKDNRPWVNISGASTAEIWKTVSQCPSGALTCVYNHDIRVVFDEAGQCALAYDGDDKIGECCYEVPGSGPASDPATATGSDPTAITWTIVHTGVAPEYEGKGIAKRLVFKVAEEAEKRKLKLIPVCSYAVKVLERPSV
ncbi:MAG: GNAT family N-acetyltransferase [Lachnospiraceae bacterium]|nr:GNAT family N-acetyltransferase [Lachnospiraceae bacterium]